MDSKRLALSKSILEMKFMKRTKDKVEKQQFQEEGEEYFGSTLTSRMKEASGKFFMEPSYIFCEGLIDGRLSYQGMNPTIEKLMEAKENAKRAQTDIKEELDVSDEQMAEWQKMQKFLMHRKIARKPQHKANRKSQHSKTDCDEPMEKKPKFLKPVD